MALLWIDGFDHYGTSSTSINTLPLPYSMTPYLSGTTGSIVTSSPGPGTALQLTGGNNGGTYTCKFYRSLGAVYTSGTLGAGFHFTLGTTRTLARGIFTFFGTNGNALSGLYINSTGNLLVRAGGTGVGTSVGSLDQESTAHIELQWTIHSTEGRVVVKVNGATWLDIQGIDTSGSYSNWGLGQDNGGQITTIEYEYDNLYIYDTSGDFNNDWFGERAVYTLFPDGDGSEQDWTLSSGSDAYALLDDVPPDDDEGISTDVVDAVSSFSLDDLPNNDISIVGVVAVSYGAKSNAAPSEIQLGFDGTYTDGIFFNQTHAYHSVILEKNPDTELEWQPSEINNLELSVKRVV